MTMEGGPKTPEAQELDTPLAKKVNRFVQEVLGSEVRLGVESNQDTGEYDFVITGSPEDTKNVSKVEQMLLTCSQINAFMKDGDYRNARKLAESATKFQSESEKDLQEALLGLIDRAQ